MNRRIWSLTLPTALLATLVLAACQTGGTFGQAWFPVTDVRQYDIATVETTLYDTKTRQVVWASSTETFNPTSVVRETPRFADFIIAELQAWGIIAGATP